MKIAAVNARLVSQPLENAFAPNWARGVQQRSLMTTLVEIVTDEGVTGYSSGPATSYEQVAGINIFVKPALLGLDPFKTEQVSAVLAGASLRMGWPWFVEAAVWDIIGKATGQPVYRLLGASNDRLRLYASTGEVREPQARLESVVRFVEEGFQAVKLRLDPADVDGCLETIRLIRKDHGSALTIMVDANQADQMPGARQAVSWDGHAALQTAKQLADFGVAWLEEPLPRHDYRGLARLAAASPIPLAGGEKNQGFHEFKRLIDEGCYDILQPDCVFSAGLFQVRKIAAMAEAANKLCIPHTWSRGPGLYANLQLAASMPNCSWFEYPYDPPNWTDSTNFGLFTERLKFEDGYVVMPDRPGLGFDLDLEKVERYTIKIPS